MLEKELYIEIDRPNYSPIYSVQYDYNSRFYNITILNNSQPLDLTDLRVIVAGKKPDGETIFNTCKVLDAKKGRVQLELTEQMNSVTGVSEYALELFSNDGMLSSQPFELRITKSTISKSVASSSELSALQNALNEVQDIDNRFAQTNAQLSDNSSYLIKSYGLKCDGTDSYKSLQKVIDAVADNKTNIVFPNNSTFILESGIIIPGGITIDFNYSNFIAINTISTSPIIIKGSNTIIKNLNIVQDKNDFSAIANVDGVSVQSKNDVDNVMMINCSVEGFENCFSIKMPDGKLATNVAIENCYAKKAEMAGINLVNCSGVYIKNCISEQNRLDGLKFTKNATNVYVDGGSYSNNFDPVGVYADGIDLYAGGKNVIINGVICDGNGGAGIHILSGEDSINGDVCDIIISNCKSEGNLGNGFDVVNKSSVISSPYVNSVLITNCLSKSNKYGFFVQARNVNIENCVAKENLRNGIYLYKSIFILISNSFIIKNSIQNKGNYSGVYIDSSKHIKINSTFINGFDEKMLKEEVEGEKWHSHGIHVKHTSECDYLYFDDVTMLNNKEERQILVEDFSLEENKDKTIIANLYFVTTPIGNCNFSAGSTVVFDGNRYTKNTNLNSTSWTINRNSRSGVKEYYMDNTDTMVIPHNLGVTPTFFTVVPCNLKSAEKGNYYVEADSTNIYIKYLTVFTTTLKFNWYAE